MTHAPFAFPAQSTASTPPTETRPCDTQ